MIIFIFLISKNLLYAFNEDLTAVHYSIVTPGIDEEIKPGMSHTVCHIRYHKNSTFRKDHLGSSYFDWKCVDCTVVRDGDSIVVENRFTEHSDFELSASVQIRESQNVRLTIELVDYVADLVQDNSLARTTVEAYMDYGNDLHSENSNINCIEDCINGIFLGNIDVKNWMSGTYKLVMVIHAFTQDKFKLKQVSMGDFVLASEIFEESKGNSFENTIEL